MVSTRSKHSPDIRNDFKRGVFQSVYYLRQQHAHRSFARSTPLPGNPDRQLFPGNFPL